MSHKDDLVLIKSLLDDLQHDETMKKMYKKYKVDISDLHLVPICFQKDLDVSARSDHGVIYLNESLKDDIENIKHYIIHEGCHNLQQTTGDNPTQGAADGDYLENKYEIEGFQNQTEYIAREKGEEEAEDYIEQVLDHHDLRDKKREKTKDNLLALTSKYFELAKRS